MEIKTIEIAGFNSALKIEITQITPWSRALTAALETVGKNSTGKEPNSKWKQTMLLAEHSPIRLIEYDVRIINIPYFVAMHFVRHKHGVEHFCSTSRSDRTGTNRMDKRQTDLINMQISLNAQAFMNISRKRLCCKADKNTRKVWSMVISELSNLDPDLASKCVPECTYRGFCPEKDYCGYFGTESYYNKRNVYIKNSDTSDFNNLVGQVFGDFEVLNINHERSGNGTFYDCQCIVCGHKAILNRYKLHLNRKHTNKNCGIYLPKYDYNLGLTKGDYTLFKIGRRVRTENLYWGKCNICGMTHEFYLNNFKANEGTSHSSCTHHLPYSPYLKRFRKIYSCMRQRTTNKNYNEWNLYGGRGVSSDYYKDFIVFYKDLFNSYVSHCKIHGEKKTSIDRINPYGNYEKGNIKWATPKEQANNKRRNYEKS